MQIVKLCFDSLQNPIGMDTVPVISWQLASDRKGTMQEAYRIVITQGEGTVWDSGLIQSERSVGIRPECGLVPYTKYRCEVTARSNHGEQAKVSGIFETGKMDDPWTARWICAEGEIDDDEKVPPYHFLKEYPLTDKKRIVKACMYVTALGCFQVNLNGRAVSEDYFSPGYTQYTDRVLYCTYDVTDLVKDAAQISVDAEVSGGWYAGRLGLSLKRGRFGKKRAFLMELHLQYEDGKREILKTDTDWEYTQDGPRRFADFFDGEVYDANRKDPALWKRQKVTLLKEKTPKILAHMGVPVRRHGKLTPEEIPSAQEGKQLFRFERNFAGIVMLTDVEAHKGQEIVIRHGELVQDGVLYTGNLRTAKAELHYICKEGLQSYAPQFTYMGFQYVEVSGMALSAEQITAFELYSDMEQTGDFFCSDEWLNRLHCNILTSTKANFMDIPTDCPQRDERCGWTGDISVFAPTASYLFDTGRFMKKWCGDIRACQTHKGIVPVIVPDGGFGHHGLEGLYGFAHRLSDAIWGDCITMVPWAVYRTSADPEILEENYEGMKAWLGYERRQAFKPFSHGYKKYIWSWGLHFGDWLAPGETIIQNMKKAKWICTAYYANSARIVADSAKILGKEEEAKQYGALYEQIREAFRKAFIGPDHHITDGFQTVYALALIFDLLDAEERRTAAKDLNADVIAHGYHLTTGFAGTAYILEALSANGYEDTAWRLLMQEDCPGWLYPVKCGAASVWERWDALKEDGSVNNDQVGSDNMVSFNHYAYGSVGLWMYENIGGIRMTQAGYKEIQIEPKPGGGLTWAKCSHRSPYGIIETFWQIKEENERQILHLHVHIPCNVRAQIWITGRQIAEVGSGDHDLEEELGQETKTVCKG